MRELKITDVRALPGDSAFLIDDGKTAILFDTSFAFTGYQVAEKVKELLGERTLDYILLSHSHYDHVLGAPYVLRYYPEAVVIAGEYAKKIFDKPSAKAIMRDLDRSYAEKCGVTEYEDLIDELKVDIAVSDGDIITCGDMDFKVINLPGHTRCSVAFYMEENKLLLGSETLGVYFGGDAFLPFYLVGYKMTLDAFQKIKQYDIQRVLFPHYGVVEGAQARMFLEKFEEHAREIAGKIKEILEKGGSTEDALAYYEETYYTENVKPTYPIDAFHLNTSIMIELIKKELL